MSYTPSNSTKFAMLFQDAMMIHQYCYNKSDVYRRIANLIRDRNYDAGHNYGFFKTSSRGVNAPLEHLDDLIFTDLDEYGHWYRLPGDRTSDGTKRLWGSNGLPNIPITADDSFEEMIKNVELLRNVDVHYYANVELLELEKDGTFTINQWFVEAILICVYPQSLKGIEITLLCDVYRTLDYTITAINLLDPPILEENETMHKHQRRLIQTFKFSSRDINETQRRYINRCMVDELDDLVSDVTSMVATSGKLKTDINGGNTWKNEHIFLALHTLLTKLHTLSSFSNNPVENFKFLVFRSFIYLKEKNIIFDEKTVFNRLKLYVEDSGGGERDNEPPTKKRRTESGGNIKLRLCV
jgi:hypothetical protein